MYKHIWMHTCKHKMFIRTNRLRFAKPLALHSSVKFMLTDFSENISSYCLKICPDVSFTSPFRRDTLKSTRKKVEVVRQPVVSNVTLSSRTENIKNNSWNYLRQLFCLCTCVSVTLWSIYANELLQVIAACPWEHLCILMVHYTSARLPLPLQLRLPFPFLWSVPWSAGQLSVLIPVCLTSVLRDPFPFLRGPGAVASLLFLQHLPSHPVFISISNLLGYSLVHPSSLLPFPSGALPGFCRVLWSSPSSSASPCTFVTFSCSSGSHPCPFKREHV